MPESCTSPIAARGKALTDVLGGQVQIWFGPLPVTIEYVRTGRLRALAVTTPRLAFHKFRSQNPARLMSAQTTPGVAIDGSKFKAVNNRAFVQAWRRYAK
jgi:tripartite-type tricarboxylate transporter receptor subunit TctC